MAVAIDEHSESILYFVKYNSLMVTVKRKRETTVRREQIAQAALAIVARQGLSRLSVAGVARRVGLVPSAIYRHYRGKEEVVDAVLELVRERLFDNLRAVTIETGDALERLQRLLTRHVALLQGHPGIVRIVFSEDVYTARPARRARVFRIVKAYLQGVEDIVRAGQATKLLKPDLDPPTIALMFLGLFQPVTILAHISNGEVDVVRHTEQAWQVFAGAIRAA